jgi:hypothetical protein
VAKKHKAKGKKSAKSKTKLRQKVVLVRPNQKVRIQDFITQRVVKIGFPSLVEQVQGADLRHLTSRAIEIVLSSQTEEVRVKRATGEIETYTVRYSRSYVHKPTWVRLPLVGPSWNPSNVDEADSVGPRNAVGPPDPVPDFTLPSTSGRPKKS